MVEPGGPPQLLHLLAPKGGDLMLVVAVAGGRVMDCNESACAALGYARDELLGLPVTEVSPLPSPQAFARTWRPLTGPEGRSQTIAYFRRKDGTTFPVDVRFSLHNIEGEEAVLGVAREAPTEPAMESALRHAEHDYQGILRNLPGIVYRASLDGAVHWIDGRVEQLTGYERGQFLEGGMRFSSLVASHAAEDPREMTAAMLTAFGAYDTSYTIVRADGEHRIVRDIAHSAFAEDGQSLVVEGILFDITQRVEEERVLREALAAEHRRYEQVVAASGQVIYEHDIAADSMHFSGSLWEVFGYTAGTHGAHPEDWKSRVHPDDLPRIAAEGNRAVATRRPVDLEYRYRHADGRYRWVWDRCVCDFADDGTPIRIVGVMQDVTERRELEAQVRAAQRMETIGALTGSVAHDLNNFLTSVLVNLAMVRMQLGHEGDMPELQDASEAAGRGAELVRSLLDFARRQEPRREPIEAAILVAESLRLLGRLAGPEVQIEVNVREGCPTFPGDPVQIQQVLMNLVVNARDAMSGRGAVTIEFEPASASHPETGEEGEFVRLHVADTGPGVPPEIRQRIFQPYFTTRAPGEGTGLGLSIVHGVAESHGGWAELASSAPGQGARFAVYFPSGA